MRTFSMFATDFYKLGHIRQYPDNTTLVYSNLTPRSDRLFKGLPDFDHKIVFFGLQGFIQEVLQDQFNDNFFALDEQEVIATYHDLVSNALGAENAGYDHIVALHRLGYLPIRIKALPEGSRVSMKVPVFTVENTLPEFYWVTNFLETLLSSNLWKGSTNATIAYEYRRLLDRFADLTGSDKFLVNFQGHDFSARGMSGMEDAVRTGSAHLVSFMGTDTVGAIEYIQDYYRPEDKTTITGGSVPATEHSVMCMGGFEDEQETFRRLIEDTYPKGIVSIVSDTWDFWKVMTEFTVNLKDKILARDGKVVFRPDSGDPVKILTGYKVYENFVVGRDSYWDLDGESFDCLEINGKFYEYEVDYGSYEGDERIEIGEEIPEHVVKGAVEILWDNFGGTETSTGYKLLDSHVGLIYGDSITLQRAQDILQRLADKGFASGNVVFGIGSYTYQYNTRDTFGFAVKATYGEVDGVGRELFKDPKTDSGTKKSARGLLRVDLVDGEYVLKDQVTREEEQGGELRVVFEDGELYNYEGLDVIRKRLLG